METSVKTPEETGLQSYNWLLSYKTSSTVIDGRPIDILKDFYIPALQRAVCYDRVAGYFRSSSLAAASQGFSSFVGRQGKMRLIVGADLEADDVKAILAGDKDRLAAALNGELDQPKAWPENVKNGVTLLAWMVAHGHLEVRVAFRVHRETGEPLSYDAVDDGYVHEKWFVLHDESGNRMYGAGTLNESKTALVLNAENIDVHCDWWGKTDCWRVDKAVESFESLWAGRVPHMPVMSLPEAVHRRLLRFAAGINHPVEIDGTVSAPKVVRPPSAMERLKFAVLRDAPKMPGGRYVGMETAPVEPWPHQAIVVRRLVETWPYSYMLCDEVGLGKTIEAGLAFRSLYLSGLAKRILIAAPGQSLGRQWHREMASKMLLPFGRVHTTPEISHEYILPYEEHRQANSIYDPDLVIMSTGLLVRNERQMALMVAKQFDIALVDEAHAARRHNPSAGPGANPDYGNLYLAVRDNLRVKTKSLWLATATPMQINPVEVYDLLRFVNRVGAFQFDPILTQHYYKFLGKMVCKQDIDKYEWSFLRHAVKSVMSQDPMLWRFIEENVIDSRIRATARQWLENGRTPPKRDRELLLRLIFSASPLSRVMLRHTRRLLEIYRANGQLKQNLATRHIEPMPVIKFTPLEQHVYDQLEDYCQGLAGQIAAHGDKQSRQMISFLLSFLRLRFASSLYAFRETLQNRLNKVEATFRSRMVEEDAPDMGALSLEDYVYDYEEEGDLPYAGSLLKNRSPEDLKWERDRLNVMIGDMADLTGPSSKMKELFQRLDRRKNRQTGRIEQTVIFTRFYDTLTDIVNRLYQVNPGILTGTYSGRGAEYYDPGTGRMVASDRESVKERFLRGEIDVLVCTDAAAEGLNLQTADLLINFDLGWNPMKIEQRIGRIDRIGQKHKDIYVLNLCYLGSAEQIVYGRLLSRLANANMIVGTQQVSLLPVTPEEFKKLAERQMTEQELEVIARERIEIQRKQTESMEINPEDLYSIYTRMEQKNAPAPVNLAAIWEALSGSQYLKETGCVATGDGKLLLNVAGLEYIPDGTVLTASRQTYEEGLADGKTRIHFASYGDPFFDAILDNIGSFDMPACARRISVSVPGMDNVEKVIYAAVCYNSGGGREIRIIRSWADLDNLRLAETESLTEAEAALLQEQLEQMVRDEFEPYIAADRVQRENIRTAYAHEILNFLVVQGLFNTNPRFNGKGTLFYPVSREILSLYEDRNHVHLPYLPADILRSIKQYLLFECSVPVLGDKAALDVPGFLAQIAINSAIRIADRMKVKKKELRVDTVLARLQREIEARKRLLV